MYYMAYGSNINPDQMKFRCPAAKLVGKGTLNNYELVFRGSDGNGVATIEYKPNSITPVLIWDIPENNLFILDRYEGYPTVYYRKKLRITINKEKLTCVVYIKHKKYPIGRPSRKYVNTIRKGYEKYNLPTRLLELYLEENSKVYYSSNTEETRELVDRLSIQKYSFCVNQPRPSFI